MAKKRVPTSPVETPKSAPVPDDPRTSLPALVLFTDIRGFTSWAENTEVFAHLNRFTSSFLELIRKRVPQERTLVKGLGDGAMIVFELVPEENTPERALTLAMQVIDPITAGFQTLCSTFAREVGHQTKLRLGWGVVRGEVKKLKEATASATEDYVGSNVNKAARLCDLARPHGIVLDLADFPNAEDWPGPRFYQQTRRLSGLNEVEVWVTEDISTQLLPRERLRETPEVHVAGLCVDPTDRGLRLLLARRSATRTLFPNLIEGCGGQLRQSETFTDGVQRHFRLEMKLDVRVLEEYHCFYVIREANLPTIPGIRFLCQRLGNTDPSSPNHSRVWWVSESEFRKIPPDEFVGQLKEEVIRLLDHYKADQKATK